MNYLYHRVPQNMFGNRIVPLSKLKYIDSNLYDEQRRKYLGREALMQDVIHPLRCLWNEVVFLSPVHPKIILDALTEAGGTMPGREFFQINPQSLDPSLTTIWLHEGDEKTPDSFVPFIPENLDRCSHLPPRTCRYYRSKIESGTRPLIFSGIPHILFKGDIDISSAEKITV